MKKHFLMISTILFGILICFASCKNNKNNRADDEDDEDDIEAVDEDLDDEIDEDDDVVPEDTYGAFADIKNMDDLKKVNVDEMSSDEAENFLNFAAKLASKELPQDTGDGMQIVAFAVEGDDVAIHMKIDEAQAGMTMEQFKMAIEMPEVKQSMLASLSGDADADMAFLLKIIKKAGKNFAMKFVGADTGDMAVLRLTNDEMAQLVK